MNTITVTAPSSTPPDVTPRKSAPSATATAAYRNQALAVDEYRRRSIQHTLYENYRLFHDEMVAAEMSLMGVRNAMRPARRSIFYGVPFTGTRVNLKSGKDYDASVPVPRRLDVLRKEEQDAAAAYAQGGDGLGYSAANSQRAQAAVSAYSSQSGKFADSTMRVNDTAFRGEHMRIKKTAVSPKV